MDPFIMGPTLVAIGHFIAAHAFLALVVTAAAITLAGIMEWFEEREQILEQNKDALAISIGSMIENKQYVEIPGLFAQKSGTNRVIQAIYDKKENKIIDMRAITANAIEPEIARAHAQQNLVVYTR
jgi:hypothetical protein